MEEQMGKKIDSILADAVSQEYFQRLLASTPEADNTWVEMELSDDDQITFLRKGKALRHFPCTQASAAVQALISRAAEILDSSRQLFQETEKVKNLLRSQETELAGWVDAVQMTLKHHYPEQVNPDEILSATEIKGRFYIGNSELSEREVKDSSVVKNIKEIITVRDSLRQEVAEKKRQLSVQASEINSATESAKSLLMLAGRSFQNSLEVLGYDVRQVMLAAYLTRPEKSIFVAEININYELGSFPASSLPEELLKAARDKIVIRI